MVLLMYLAVLPPENNPLIDDHIIYALVFLFLGMRAHAMPKRKDYSHHNHINNYEKRIFTPIEKETIANEIFVECSTQERICNLSSCRSFLGEKSGSRHTQKMISFSVFEEGEGKVIVGETEYIVGDGDTVIVPAGTPHNVINTGSGSLKLYNHLCSLSSQRRNRSSYKEEGDGPRRGI